MKWRAFSLLLLASQALADTYQRQPGLDVLHYRIAIELFDRREEIRATTRVDVRFLSDGLETVRLDFGSLKIDSIRSEGRAVPYSRVRQGLELSLARPALRNDEASFEISYRGRLGRTGLSIARNRFGRRVFFAENWPDHARDWFPCVDHPGDKATVDFDVTAPPGYTVIASGTLEGEENLGGRRRRTRWTEKVPIPTYCMVVGAADFKVIRAGDFGTVPVTYWAFPEDAARAARRFDRTPAVLEFLQTLLGPYPFGKLAQVEATTRIGGMENAGNIFYAEGLFKKEPQDDAPVPHEIAHQWFGNSVTPADWDHLWLSEGFATYLDALFAEYTSGRDGLEQTMAAAALKIAEYEKEHRRPVIDPGVSDPLKKLTPLTYEKGAWVLHMLRGVLGDEAFFRGMRGFYTEHRLGNAVTSDFQRAMEAAGGVRLGWFFEQWLRWPGHPVYEVHWSWDETARELAITVSQKQPGEAFDMPVQIAVWAGGRRQDHGVRIAGRKTSLRIPAAERPERVEFDPSNHVLKDLVLDKGR